MKTLVTLALALGLAFSSMAQGFVEAIDSFSSPTSGGGDGTIGYTFRANADLSVTDIGVFAYIVDVSSPMRVGLWDSSGNLLADQTITAANPLIGSSRYASLTTPVSLVAQQVYHIGAYSPNLFSYSIVGGGDGSVTTSPGVSILSYALNETGFAFPTVPQAGEGFAAITANFRYPGVPEPSVASLVLLGGLSLAALRRRSS